MAGGEYVFVDWVRRGFGALSGGAAVKVALDVGPAGPVSRQVATYVPADITGLDPRAVARTSPRDGTQDFEPNLFPMVELADPGLPWLASTGAAPWIALVVVEDRPGVTLASTNRGTTLSIQTPASVAEELPDLAQAAAWAHAQDSLSRLVAPRKLVAGRGYHACIVPAFAAGVAAALGNPVTGDGPAWTAQTTSITLPVLYQERTWPPCRAACGTAACRRAATGISRTARCTGRRSTPVPATSAA